MVTDPPTNGQGRLQYTAPQLARNVKKQAVRVATQYAPPAVRRTLRLGRCGPAAAHPYACGAQRTLLPIAVGTHEY